MQSTGEGLKLNLSINKIIILCLDINIKVLHSDVLALTFAISHWIYSIFKRTTKNGSHLVFLLLFLFNGYI
jgi:hypothetical protein